MEVLNVMQFCNARRKGSVNADTKITVDQVKNGREKVLQPVQESETSSQFLFLTT